jgi:hypothetical protein
VGGNTRGGSTPLSRIERATKVSSAGAISEVDYYSERVKGARPRQLEELTVEFWGGIVSLMRRGVNQAWFGEDFPEMCEEGQGISGCSEYDLSLALRAEFDDLSWPLRDTEVPPLLTVLDLLEFLYRHASKPTKRDFHNFYRHDHLDFDREAGQEEMRERINRLLGRAGLRYELTFEGQIERLGSPAVEAQLARTLPATADVTFDDLLQVAIDKFHSPDPAVRREALEAAWDAFERMKTLLSSNKREGAEALVAAASEGSSETEEELLGDEMKTLTTIGNEFRIRHHEVNAVEPSDELVDYLFGRVYSLIYRMHEALP